MTIISTVVVTGNQGADPVELLQHLGASVLLCWNELPFQAQVKILAQTSDVVGTRPIADARNVPPCTAGRTPGERIWTPPPSSAYALNPRIFRSVLVNQVPFA